MGKGHSVEKGPPLSSMEHSGRVQEAREKLLAVARERLQSIEKAASKRQPQDPRPQADSESSGLPSPLSQCSSSLPSPMSSPRKEGIVEGNVASRDIGLRRRWGWYGSCWCGSRARAREAVCLCSGLTSGNPPGLRVVGIPQDNGYRKIRQQRQQVAAATNELAAAR